MLQRLIRSCASIFDLFLEVSCPLCGRSTAKTLCLDCQRQVNRCRLGQPAQTWRGVLPMFVWGGYKGTLKQAIAAMKYDNQPQIARLLGHWLGEAWLTHASLWKSQALAKRCLGSSWVVPIPLHANKLRQRGYNQAVLLAESFCQVTGLPLAKKGLVRIRETEAQFSLNAMERQRNLIEAFQIGEAFRRCPPMSSVLLLDDIYTTGSTACSAANTLRRQGITVMGIAAIAGTMASPIQSAKEREIGFTLEDLGKPKIG